MCARFFFRYRDVNDRLNAIAKRKEAERRSGIISDIGQDDAKRNEEHERIIKQQYKKSRCFEEGELRRILDEAVYDAWVVALLAENDVSKFSQIRKSLYIDSMTALINKVKQSR